MFEKSYESNNKKVTIYNQQMIDYQYGHVSIEPNEKELFIYCADTVVKNLKRVLGVTGVTAHVSTGTTITNTKNGKSTLLHQLGLLDTPSGGHILIDGTDVSHEPWHMEYFDRIIFIRDGVMDEERIEHYGKFGDPPRLETD